MHVRLEMYRGVKRQLENPDLELITEADASKVAFQMAIAAQLREELKADLLELYDRPRTGILAVNLVRGIVEAL